MDGASFIVFRFMLEFCTLPASSLTCIVRIQSSFIIYHDDIELQLKNILTVQFSDILSFRDATGWFHINSLFHSIFTFSPDDISRLGVGIVTVGETVSTIGSSFSQQAFINAIAVHNVIVLAVVGKIEEVAAIVFILVGIDDVAVGHMV